MVVARHCRIKSTRVDWVNREIFEIRDRGSPRGGRESRARYFCCMPFCFWNQSDADPVEAACVVQDPLELREPGTRYLRKTW